MKLMTLIQAGALVLLAMYGAYASAQASSPCTAASQSACDL